MNRVSSAYSPNDDEGARRAAFEETYPRYEFAEMVRIGLVLAEWLAAGAGWLARTSRLLRGARLGGSRRLPPGEVRPAE